MRPAVPTRQRLDAACQAPRTPSLNGQVRAPADAAPGRPFRARVAPHDQRRGRAHAALQVSSRAASANCSVAPRVSPV